ncbi:PREDICTED: THAP domain-containing protein 1-like [Trachymyrmex cornetzi]|uniref:THAP domain-containing protein 1-like n=1 Tax=Trachymyrmex cornetzi TaxID=471704 RepID=UPI00084F124E|nr:PREDICTED: THAP domain-containing protein 1-like [Trachymyrmex cornetzi]
MVYTCWVCKWRGDKEPKRSFHKFPSCENERKKWKHILGINVVLGARTTICSLHFTEDCFHYGVHGRRLLKEGSFPSLYLPTPAVAFVLEERTGPLTNESECSTKNIAIKRKWHAGIDIKPGICEAALEILTEKHVKANNTGKKLVLEIPAQCRTGIF